MWCVMKKVSLYPADVYQVIDKSLLSSSDKLVLNMLYMPIIGNIAVMLYFFLQTETKNTFKCFFENITFGS